MKREQTAKRILAAARRIKKLRPEVAMFARVMEWKLRQNDHKRNWRCCTVSYLLKRLDDEVRELHETFPHDQEAALEEAADVANFSMMIASYHLDQIISADAAARKRRKPADWVPEGPSPYDLSEPVRRKRGKR